ncbi:MAG TPA: NADPH-dependent oxidoreductase, partial [Clostridiaceae bacterium]|nr:NADPH-dependent oxidoreductase [Clostridiaceae bacterium]
MNETIKHQLNHCTRRQFSDQPISSEIINTLAEVAFRTATHMHMQAWSIIRVTDAKIRQRLADIARQPHLKYAPELWIFIVDCRRNLKIAQAQGYTGQAGNTLDRFMQGYIDACLAAQNVLNAVESLDMGGVYFGSIAHDYQGTCEALAMPELTFPVVGLGFGYPTDDVLLKPRLPRQFRFFENTYADTIDKVSDLAEFDAELTCYYDVYEPGRSDAAFSKKVFKH